MSQCPFKASLESRNAAATATATEKAKQPPRQNSFQLGEEDEEEDTQTLKLKHLSEALAILTNPPVRSYSLI